MNACCPRLCTGVIIAVLVPLMMGQGCLGFLNPTPAETEIQNVSPTEFKALIDSHQGDASFVTIDVRNPEEFAGGHIEGAVNVCFLCPTFSDAIGALDKNLTYLVYCGSNHRSPLACEAMKAQGFTHIYNMTGGLNEWRSQGLPVVQ